VCVSDFSSIIFFVVENTIIYDLESISIIPNKKEENITCKPTTNKVAPVSDAYVALTSIDPTT
jgi:hypothetical protein